MKLDELKKAWAESEGAINRVNRDVFEIIRNKSEGPAPKLKKRFKRGMIIIPVITGIGIAELSGRRGFMTHAVTWYLLGFCLAMMIYFYLNYRLMMRMERVEGNVKENLQKQVKLLKNGLQWRLLVTRALVVSFMALTELLMYYKVAPEFEQWNQQSIMFRLGVYAGFILLFYLITKFATDFRYKKHILRLEGLIEQLR